jgi:hypothetical protein
MYACDLRISYNYNSYAYLVTKNGCEIVSLSLHGDGISLTSTRLHDIPIVLIVFIAMSYGVSSRLEICSNILPY